MPLTQRTGRPTERQARTHACSYTSIHAGGQANTHTNELKEKRGYLDMGWGTQPQQCDELTGSPKNDHNRIGLDYNGPVVDVLRPFLDVLRNLTLILTLNPNPGDVKYS